MGRTPDVYASLIARKLKRVEAGAQVVRAQLLQHISQAQPARAIDDQAHGAFCAVFDQVDQRLGKVRIGHLRHGDQEVMLEVAGRGAFHAR